MRPCVTLGGVPWVAGVRVPSRSVSSPTPFEERVYFFIISYKQIFVPVKDWPKPNTDTGGEFTEPVCWR